MKYVTTSVIFLALTAVFAEEEAKKYKRGIFGGSFDFSHDFSSHSLDLSHGGDWNSGYDHHHGPIDLGSHIQKHTTITKKIGVPIPQPYPVTVEKKIPVPYPVEVKVPVAKPFPVYVPKPYPVHVEKPVPYTVEKHVPYPVKVPVKVPYKVPIPVHIPKPYPVTVTKHVPVYIPKPVWVKKPVPVFLKSHGWKSW